MKRLTAIIVIGLSISFFAISQDCDKPLEPKGYWVEQEGALIYFEASKVIRVK